MHKSITQITSITPITETNHRKTIITNITPITDTNYGDHANYKLVQSRQSHQSRQSRTLITVIMPETDPQNLKYVITPITEAIFQEKSETRDYGGSEKFFGQKAQSRKYVITQSQKAQNHPLILPLVVDVLVYMSLPEQSCNQMSGCWSLVQMHT